MKKIASPSDLDSELKRLISANREGITRDEMASKLASLADRMASSGDLSDQDLTKAKKIEVISGEGTGSGTTEGYKGKKTVRALKSLAKKESSGGDRWVFVKVDGDRYDFRGGTFQRR